MTHFLLKKLAMDVFFFPAGFFSAVLAEDVFEELVEMETPIPTFC